MSPSCAGTKPASPDMEVAAQSPVTEERILR
jgi:hypothetical protein